LRASTQVYRYGAAVGWAGLDNYIRLWSDEQFLNALWVSIKFVFLAVSIEAVLGFSLALFCLREFKGIRLLRSVLIIPMVITPVVVAILFRPIYASERAFGRLEALSVRTGAGPPVGRLCFEWTT
jgi:multiple sugar transport system permease protein